jgi:uncharacterized protein YjbI with pentapeptide repeats
MANPEHVRILKESVEAWNQWRRENPDIAPNLNMADLSRAKLRRANLRGAKLHGTDLSGADLVQAKLRGANLTGAHLIQANLNGAHLRRADLSSANLSTVDLRGADLSGANLSGTDLSAAELSGANLSGTDLSAAELSGADLSGTSLRRADLSGANLRFTNFTNSHMVEANFMDAVMLDTVFVDVDLSQVKGLEMVRHAGPSRIGIDTIQRSQGKIPDIFLRGAGVSDEFIAVIRAMRGAIQFYSCFISYSTQDQLFAERLYADLQARGVRCWFAPHDVQGGRKLHEQIDEAIRVHERLLLILSPSSIHSEWVKTEIAKARKREVLEKRRMLFPVMLKIGYKELTEWECFDADTGKDSAREIREYYIPDFSQWESPEKYNEEFEKLVRDLKKAEAAAAEAG